MYEKGSRSMGGTISTVDRVAGNGSNECGQAIQRPRQERA